MFEFIQLFLSFIRRIFFSLDVTVFYFNGMPVSLLSIFGAGLAISIVVTIFWKGAKG